MKSVFDASNLAEVMRYLKEEGNFSQRALAERIGIGQTTVHRVLAGDIPDVQVLDNLAVYARVPRDWLYQIAFGLEVQRTHSPTVAAVANLLEAMPEDLQEMFLAQVRSVVDRRKTSPKLPDKP